MAMDQIDDVIQRWRDTPESALTPGDHQLFLNLWSQGNSAQMLSLVKEDKNQQIVRSMGSGLVGFLVSEMLKKENTHSDCQAIITHLVQTCSPDELLYALLEQLKDPYPDAIADIIEIVAPHLQTVLLSLGESKASAVGLTLSTLQKQVSRLPVPYTEDQVDSDKLGLCRCCTTLGNFIEPFVDEVKRQDSRHHDATTQDHQLRTELLKFCMESLRQPLLQAQLVQAKKTPLGTFATNILLTLLAIQEPLPELLFYSSLRKGLVIDSDQCQESRASLAYLLFVQLISIESFPAVFSPMFVLRCNMEYINTLLSRKEESWLLKGLALFTTSLERTENNSLPVELLEINSFYSVPQSLLLILTDCPIQHLREQGLKVFQLFIDKLDAAAKHKFFRCMLSTSHHVGVQGYVIKNIRNQVNFSMEPGNMNDWFLGSPFLPLLALVLHLPQGSETDLLGDMDRIMESLNLIRFLLITDNNWRSIPGAWSELCHMKDEYLRILTVCISLSRSLNHVQTKKLKEDHKVKAREVRMAGGSQVVQNMTVRQEKVDDFPPEIQYQILQSARVTFDLMESLIVRIEEIAKEKAQQYE